MTTTPETLARWRSNLQGEIDGAAVYRAMAEGSRDPKLTELYARLAATEERHAALWRDHLEAARVAVSTSPTARARILALIARRLGPGWVASTMASAEAAAQTQCDDQPEAKGTSLPADERSHAQVLGELTKGCRGRHPGPLRGSPPRRGRQRPARRRARSQ